METPKTTPDLGPQFEALCGHLLLSTTEVADWHFVDITLRIDRGRPLIRLLFDVAFSPLEVFGPIIDVREPEKDLAIA